MWIAVLINVHSPFNYYYRPQFDNIYNFGAIHTALLVDYYILSFFKMKIYFPCMTFSLCSQCSCQAIQTTLKSNSTFNKFFNFSSSVMQDLKDDPFRKDDFTTIEDDREKERKEEVEEEKRRNRRDRRNAVSLGGGESKEKTKKRQEVGLMIKVDNFR